MLGIWICPLISSSLVDLDSPSLLARKFHSPFSISVNTMKFMLPCSLWTSLFYFAEFLIVMYLIVPLWPRHCPSGSSEFRNLTDTISLISTKNKNTNNFLKKKESHIWAQETRWQYPTLKSSEHVMATGNSLLW